MFIRRLAISNFLSRKTRVALTVAAIALSVSLVVAVTSGYNSVEGAVHQFMDKFMGSVDAQISRQNDPRGKVGEAVLDALRHDRDVSKANGRVETESTLLNEKGEVVEGRNTQIFGVSRPGDTRVDLLELEKGRWFNTPDADEAVIDQALAEVLKVGPGGTVTLPGERKTTLTIVGIVHKPELLASQVRTMYAPLRTIQRYLGNGWDQPPYFVNRITVELKKGADPRAFAARFAPELAKVDATAKLKLTRDSRADLDKNMGAVHMLSYLGGTVSMLAATFIVFSALSMGVSERQRTLAMLRAVGAFRSQIGMLVVVEGMLLAAVGVGVGVPLGWLWVKILSRMFRDVFSAGVLIDWKGVLLGSGGSMLAALAASILPAWWATRVSALEAMTPDSSPPRARTPYWSAALGLVLISIDPFLFFGPLQRVVAVFDRSSHAAEHVRTIQFIAHFALGLPGIMIGFFLLAPLFVRTAERVLGPLVARAFGLNFALLRQQLSSGLWRAAGTCAALMVGLAVLVVMQVEGNSALKGWKLPTKFPDIFIISPPSVMGLFSHNGVSFEQEKEIENVDGIVPGQVMPIAIASPQFGTSIFALPKVLGNPEATMFFGIDPTRAFKMMELEFRDGTQDNAQRLLSDGQALVLKEDQSVLKPGETGIVEETGDLGEAGDPYPKVKGFAYDHDRKRFLAQGMVTDAGNAYRVALPQGEVRVVPKDQVERVEDGRFLIVTNEFKELKGYGVGSDFPLLKTDGKKAHYAICGVVWSPGIDVIVSMYDMGRQFDQRTAASVFGTLKDARYDFGVEQVYLFAANLKPGIEREELVDRVKKQLHNKDLKAGDVRHIKDRIVTTFYRLLHLASTVAFAAMAVASLGVTNTVMAGIRTRRWQFGVLRSIGVTRSQLLRLVLSEALLLGLVACVLGLAAGAVMSADAYRLSVMNTGYNPGISVPWGIVSLGAGIVLFISLAASLWPALTVARAEPLSLLQAGRSAA